MRAAIRPATEADILALAGQLRGADVREVWRAARLTPEEALRQSVALTAPRAYAVYFDDRPVAMAGISSLDVLGGVGVPWLLTGHAVSSAPGAFMRLATTLVDRWADEFPTLLQMVDAEYPGGRRFMQALGFTVGPPQPWGPDGAPFFQCVRSRNV